MKIDTTRVGSVAVVAARGPVTSAETEQWGTAIETVRHGSAGRIVLDMSAVPFTDSAALEALLDFSERQRSVGQMAKLAGLTETCREILVLTDLIGDFEVFDTIENAVRSFL